ncbi:MAG: hypothetical protein ACFFBK_11300 [Promethearchaeota archaeon]
MSESPAIMMVLSGLMVITWLGYERKRRGSFLKRKSEVEKFDVTKFLRGNVLFSFNFRNFCDFEWYNIIEFGHSSKFPI